MEIQQWNTTYSQAVASKERVAKKIEDTLIKTERILTSQSQNSSIYSSRLSQLRTTELSHSYTHDLVMKNKIIELLHENATLKKTIDKYKKREETEQAQKLRVDKWIKFLKNVKDGEFKIDE